MKKIIFKIVAVCLPLILLLLLEVILRVSGYGEDYQLFHKVPIENKPDYLVMNKRIAGKYFKDNGLRSDNQADLFLETKTDSTFRVVVQGASTVVGFPFYRGGSFPRMLKHRLSLTFPDKNIEVINTGITAVNSYTLWDLTDDIIVEKPDLVIIYAGHNEYYGALGTGSSISYGSHPFLIRTYLTLKKLRSFQLFENSYYTLLGSNTAEAYSQKPSERSTTLMEVMVKEQRIPYNSDVYNDGLKQFEGNLDKILSSYKKNDIPVILSTVVSNEKDIEPFISDTIENREGFESAMEKNSPEAHTMASKNAMAAFMLGRHYLEKNQDSAQKYLKLAKELDLLRFRAPEKINDIVVNLSKKYNTALVDMRQVFNSHSPHNIVGNELMTEHVHPNIKGQFLMADAFYNKMRALNVLDNWENYIGYAEAFVDIPTTQIDSIQGKLVVDELKKSWPYDMDMSGKRPATSYSEGGSFEELLAQDLHKKKAKWDNAMALAFNSYKTDKKYKKALTVAETLIFEYPEQGRVYQMAGNMCLQLEDFEKAEYYFSKSNYLDKNRASIEGLAKAYMMLGKTKLAKDLLSSAQEGGLKVSRFEEIHQELLKVRDSIS
ncbi:hypothetical protein K1F50_12070 [Muricauda oceani]|uniref:SGNH hydrolase-type esterase domain-containing protein n=1 Tax=Flagellimonas oceani TaxID=2698672 RepID=A0A6G7J5J2_9FLAO|nr:hypothetical protein [Allomuricauda oceani]MBW8243540.1 hypothetical protein [Allomuricauda oceani]QII45752.1 hypothetical protein GVT53_14045 [Allomuricauda oceani]